jgi:ribosome-associated protein
MVMDENLVVNDRLIIPRSELRYSASRSSGPGGQHVNTAATRIELRWNVLASAALSPEQRDRLRQVLGSRLTGDGDLVLTSQVHRSQHRHRQEVTGRLVALVDRAMRRRKIRRRTRPPAAAHERRLREKKRRGELKRQRREPDTG